MFCFQSAQNLTDDAKSLQLLIFEVLFSVFLKDKITCHKWRILNIFSYCGGIVSTQDVFEVNLSY